MDEGSPSHTAADGTPTTWYGLGPTHWGGDISHVVGELDESFDWLGYGKSVRLLISGWEQMPAEVRGELGDRKAGHRDQLRV
jgi:hypothetical protein